MTIKEAFEEYAKEPQFKKLAGMYRQSFTSVFLKNYAEVDIKEVDLKLTKKIVSESVLPPADKIRSVAALVLALQHASSKGHCTNPGFHTNDVFKDSVPEPKIKIMPEVKAKADAIIAKRTAKPAKKRKISKPRPVVQLDPKTYEPLKTYASAGEAGRAVGSTNVLRAVKERTQSAGYFWAYERDVKDFKPNELSLTHRAARFERKAKPVPTEGHITAAIEELDSEADRIHEERERLEEERRAKYDIPSQYTNDELLSEIKRREWKGNVIIPINFDL